MEEIVIHMNNQDVIYYLNLFNNIIQDEHYFNIGNYEWMNNDNLKIIYHNKNIQEYHNIDIINNVKIFKPLNNINLIEEKENKKDEIISIKHKDWEDSLLINYNNYKVKRFNSDDTGRFEINNSLLTIKWDNYDEEYFLFNQNNNTYIYKNQDNNLNHSIPNDNHQTIFIKNKTWEDNCILNNESNTCYRNNQKNEQGIFKIFDNYLYINWDNWDSELFYKVDNDIYINHNDLITSYSFHYLNESKHLYIDDKSIFNENYYSSYIDSFLYYYKINDQLLKINNINSHYEFIKINEEFYEINTNYSYILNDSYIYLTGNQTVLNDLYQIIGTFIKNKEILKITYLNKEIIDFIIENNCLTQCNNQESILTHHNSSFYLYIEDELKKCTLDQDQLFIDSKKYDFLMDDESKNIFIKYNNHVIQFNKLNNIYFEIKDFNFLNNINFDLYIYTYFNTFNDLSLNKIKQDKQNNIIYNQFSLEDNYIFLNCHQLLMDEIKYNDSLFETYGYMICNDKCIQSHKQFNEVNIINLRNLNHFKNNQQFYISNMNTFKNDFNILIIDDYEDLNYLNHIFNFKDLFKNYCIYIHYLKFDHMLYFYIKKIIYLLYLQKYLSIHVQINYFNKLINIDTLSYIDQFYNNDQLNVFNKQIITLSPYIHSYHDIIFLIILFYLNNYSLLFEQHTNFKTTIHLI
jgi:hypothetical protein